MYCYGKYVDDACGFERSTSYMKDKYPTTEPYSSYLPESSLETASFNNDQQYILCKAK